MPNEGVTTFGNQFNALFEEDSQGLDDEIPVQNEEGAAAVPIEESSAEINKENISDLMVVSANGNIQQPLPDKSPGPGQGTTPKADPPSNPSNGPISNGVPKPGKSSSAVTRINGKGGVKKQANFRPGVGSTKKVGPGLAGLSGSIKGSSSPGTKDPMILDVGEPQVSGEATITLEDVEVLTGLPTDGVLVTVAVDRRPLSVICEELLGVQPPAGSSTGQSVKISWVKGMFDHLPAGAPADVVIRYARAYTWVLLGAILLADRTGDLIPVHLLRLIGDSRVASTFSWGSAVLAWLYNTMGRAAFFTARSQRGTGDLGGFTLLVQLWALERFPHIADRYVAGGDPPDADTIPRGVRWMSVIWRHQHRVAMKLDDIRYALDRSTEFLWMLYAFREEDYQLEDDVLWRAVCPMLCIDCVAWHHPDRCMRQFGHGQRIPQDAEPAARVEELLGLDFRALVHDWGARYLEYLRLWE
ncbi:Serine/threonine-protein phosphatase 7 long form homolog [Linum perenne]